MRKLLYLSVFLLTLLTPITSCDEANKEYEVTVSIFPELSGKIEGNGKYFDKTEVTLRATPNGGYVFVGWKDEDSGRVISSDSQFTFSVDRNYKLIAGFSRVIQLPNFDFNSNIRRFKEEDIKNPPEKGGILFIGSSTFTFWTDVNDYFPGKNIINRAFGGATLNDLIYAYPDIITPYKPKQVVIYCGENDIAFDDDLSIDAVVDRFEILYDMFRRDPELGNTINIAYVSMKPSPARKRLMPKFVLANERIKAFLSNKDNTVFINIYDALLNEHGEPDRNLFLDDLLHNNENGYVILSEIMAPYLLR